jgi:hypothetical protein
LDTDAVEPVALGDLDVNEIVLLRLVEILYPVGVSSQLVLHLQARHTQFAVEVEHAEAPGWVPAPAALPRVARIEWIRPGWLGESVVRAAARMVLTKATLSGG